MCACGPTGDARNSYSHCIRQSDRNRPSAEPQSPRRKHHRRILDSFRIAWQVLFRDMLPSVRLVAALGNADDPIWKLFLEQVQLAGRTTGIEIAPAIMVELALKRGLPAATVPRSFAEVGGLMSYGPDGRDSFRRAAAFVVKILQGGKPADMPVEQPTKFELVINLKTAKALGLDVPWFLQQRADEVIE